MVELTARALAIYKVITRVLEGSTNNVDSTAEHPYSAGNCLDTNKALNYDLA